MIFIITLIDLVLECFSEFCQMVYFDGGKMQNIKWLFFDLGSTLIDETDCINDRIEQIYSFTKISKNNIRNRMYELSNNSSIPLKIIAKENGVDNLVWDSSLEKLYHGVSNILKKLSQKYKIGIIANQPFGTADRLKEWNIYEYFDVICASAEEKCAKPDLKLFEIALAKADCAPDNAVMIGDRIDNDIIPAGQLGMKTVWIKQGLSKYYKNESKFIPNVIVNSLDELLNINYEEI